MGVHEGWSEIEETKAVIVRSEGICNSAGWLLKEDGCAKAGLFFASLPSGFARSLQHA